jgi:hypothetical protein
MFTTAAIDAVALSIAILGDKCKDQIQALHKDPEGAEVLRLICRDNLCGAGDIIFSALQENLH